MAKLETRLQVKDAIAAKRTARGRAFYNDVFKYSEKSLNGLTILDIGAGDSVFSETVEKEGGKLVRLDAQYSIRPPKSDIPGAVAGLAQRLPFRDGSFDETIASFSLYWIDAGLKEALKEMVRVTKDGGMIKVCPAWPLPTATFDSAVVLDYIANWKFHTMRIYKDPSYSLTAWEKVVRGIRIGMKFDNEPEHATSFSQKYNYNRVDNDIILYNSNNNKLPLLKKLIIQQKFKR